MCARACGEALRSLRRFDLRNLKAHEDRSSAGFPRTVRRRFPNTLRADPDLLWWRDRELSTGSGSGDRPASPVAPSSLRPHPRADTVWRAPPYRYLPPPVLLGSKRASRSPGPTGATHYSSQPPTRPRPPPYNYPCETPDGLSGCATERILCVMRNFPSAIRPERHAGQAMLAWHLGEGGCLHFSPQRCDTGSRSRTRGRLLLSFRRAAERSAGRGPEGLLESAGGVHAP
jgi:hypothetical protein